MSSQPQIFFAVPDANAGVAHLLATLPRSRAAMPPSEFRSELRTFFLDHPTVTLRQVAQSLGVSRQAVAQMVGRLDRPTCAHPNRPAPRREEARHHLAELRERVARGESTESAAQVLGISLTMAMKLGFRAKAVRPPHGSKKRAAQGCDCWRCRRAAGVVRPRGPKTGSDTRARVEDWLAWTDPDTGGHLTQTKIGALAGVGQGSVSRIAKAAEKEGYSNGW